MITVCDSVEILAVHPFPETASVAHHRSRNGQLFWWVIYRVAVFDKVGVKGFARIPDQDSVSAYLAHLISGTKQPREANG